MGQVVAIRPEIEIEVDQPIDVELNRTTLRRALEEAAAQHSTESRQAVAEFVEEATMGRAMVARVWHGDKALATVGLELVRGGLEGLERVLWVRYITGSSLHEWMAELHEWLLEVARAHGCSRVGLLGRKGWARRLRPLGYKTESVELWCEVDNER